MNRTSQNYAKPIFIFTLVLYTFLTTNNALQFGHFVDGLIYGSLARNMTEGYGTFWHMKLSEELFNGFYEHPPLGLWIQSLFFRLFGDTTLIDNLFGFFTGFGIFYFMIQIWNMVVPEKKELFWFPILVFILFPMTTYVLGNNWLLISLPFYALALSYLFYIIGEKIEKYQTVAPQKINIFSLVLFFITIFIMFYTARDYRQNPGFQQDFNANKLQIEERALIYSCPENKIFRNWDLEANFQRYFKATLTRQPGQKYILTTLKDKDSCIDENDYTLFHSNKSKNYQI